MDYELCKELKTVGFPFKSWSDTPSEQVVWDDTEIPISAEPTLSELIEACGDIFGGVHRLQIDGWIAFIFDIEDSTRQVEAKGKTPSEAVARLYIALHKK